MQQSFTENMQTNNYPAVQAARKLAAAIGRSSAYHRYEEAYSHLRQDREAQQILKEFQQEQQSYQMMQSWGGASEEDYQRLLKKQEKMLTHPIIKNFFQSQEDLVALLKEINAFISEQIGIEFAGTAKPAGGCC